jgi:outer membrane protein
LSLRIPVLVLCITAMLRAQDVPQQNPASASANAPLTLTLQDALARARSNSVPFQAALTDQGVAHEDKVQARAALLPSVAYNNEFIYTQPNGTPSGVFIANNSVHEYLSQGDLHQVIGYANYADYRRPRWPSVGWL